MESIWLGGARGRSEGGGGSREVGRAGGSQDSCLGGRGSGGEEGRLKRAWCGGEEGRLGGHGCCEESGEGMFEIWAFEGYCIVDEVVLAVRASWFVRRGIR